MTQIYKKVSKQHSIAVRKRAFTIWQKTGVNPWEKPQEPRKRLFKNSSGDFYRGAFDGIPFLNEDSKRTFKHILLRPGHMIRDYVNGYHEKYLAPLTSLIVFYAFFALISSILQPIQQERKLPFDINMSEVEPKGFENEKVEHLVINTLKIVERGYILLHLDEFPEYVTNLKESTIASIERTLRSQGIPLFLSKFFFLWFAMGLALRRFKPGMPACAAATAYILCQFCFFIVFAVLLTLGRSTSISVSLMLLLLLIDYHQWLGTDFKQSLKLSIATGFYYALLYLAMLILVTAVVLLLAWLKS